MPVKKSPFLSLGLLKKWDPKKQNMIQVSGLTKRASILDSIKNMSAYLNTKISLRNLISLPIDNQWYRSDMMCLWIKFSTFL